LTFVVVVVVAVIQCCYGEADYVAEITTACLQETNSGTNSQNHKLYK